MMIEIQDTVVSLDILTEYFFCDINDCKGACCVEGDAGAPVLEEEIAVLEDAAIDSWNELSPEAQKVIDSQGVVYIDRTGDLVTSIVNNRDCVFAKKDENGCTLCAIQKCKPISCSLYPIRVSKSGKFTSLNYHQWDICKAAKILGKKKNMKVYQFLKEPLIRRFGKAWYDELELTAKEIEKANINPENHN